MGMEAAGWAETPEPCWALWELLNKGPTAALDFPLACCFGDKFWVSQLLKGVSCSPLCAAWPSQGASE